YTPQMQELIKRVEATRPQRLAQSRAGESFPAMSLEQRKEVLETYHPDYTSEGRRALGVGVNRGEVYPEELVDVLEARSVLEDITVDLNRPNQEADVLVIGAGGAGTAAAITASQEGCRVILANKLRHGDSNTVMAEGGIQAADQEPDSPYYHYLDVIGGGHFSNASSLVAAMANDAPLVIEWLESLGAMFDKHPDGRMKVRHGGGTCRKRMHSAGDMTGSEIMRVLRDETYAHEDKIRVLRFSPAVELLLDEDGRCAGAILYNIENGTYRIVKAKTTILATGGSGRLHYRGFPTTNHYGATGDGLVMAYRAGARLAFMGSVQYHPTGAAFPEQNVGLLVTEKVRGLGGQVVNIDGEQFVFPLEPRDVESAAIIRECVGKGKGVQTAAGRIGVWLDSPMIDLLYGAGAVRRELPAKYKQFQRFGIDISKQPMLVYPTLHYQNGGIEIDEHARTAVPGLYAAGETTGGVHGNNRLMGNSLLDILVFGRRAGLAAARAIAAGAEPGTPTLGHLSRYRNELKEAGLERGVFSPVVLPDYSTDAARSKRWDVRVPLFLDVTNTPESRDADG
ncbi:MAG: FAD-binding protein, partial [Gammaproteobacteria bacterium]|nr:FAD-binding protein [Gammaproteobacteria bacterium]